MNLRLPAAVWFLAAFGACGGDEPLEAFGLRRSEVPVILISLDTCRADALSWTGEPPWTTTPHLDAFAREAARFHDCWSASTGTGPAHRSLLTGQHVHRHGLYSNGLAVEPAFNLASVLHAAGYATGGIIGGGYLREAYGFGTGFDSWHRAQPGVTLGMFREAVPAALSWIDEHEGRPFFLFLHGYDPHCPYWPPEDLRRARAPGEGPLDFEDLCGVEDFQEALRRGLLDEAGRDRLRRLYLAEVEEADRRLGEFFDGLRRRGLYDRSILVFTSDHGESLGEHDFVGHVRAWGEQLQVPFLVRFPGGRWAGDYGERVQSIDLLPTILEALELEVPDGVEGLSLLPLLRGEAWEGADRWRLGKHASWEAVEFADGWKIGYRRTRQGPVERHLYDRRSDPLEERNLLQEPGGEERFQELFARFDAWKQARREEDRRYRGLRLPRPKREADLDQLGYAEGEEQEGAAAAEEEE